MSYRLSQEVKTHRPILFARLVYSLYFIPTKKATKNIQQTRDKTVHKTILGLRVTGVSVRVRFTMVFVSG